MMKTYLAVLKKDTDIRQLEKELKKNNVRLSAHYKTIGVVKLESEKTISDKDFEQYFLSVEEDKEI